LDLGLFDDSELENSESIQAHGYDRTFIVSGPVVKVYKEADHQDSEHHGLAFDMKFPILRNDEDQPVKPCNLMLHNNESQMIFCNQHDPT